MAEKVYTLEDLKAHNTEDNCWIAVDGLVYDVTAFLEDHPGGPEIIMESAGADSTNEFEDVGHSKAARDQLKDYLIGKLKDGEGVRLGAGGSSSGGSSAARGDADSGSMVSYVLPVMALLAALAWKFLYAAE